MEREELCRSLDAYANALNNREEFEKKITENYIDKHKKLIKNYISVQHNTRALLIDGEWGCGKSYFVKNSLIPYLKTEKINNDSFSEPKYYIPVYVSLFGVSSIASIQEIIYASFLEAVCTDDKSENSKTAFRNIYLFGSKLALGIGNFFNVGEDVNGVASSIGDQILHAKKEQIILIFDDFERCQVDTIELMGFLNNLCENNEYKMIIISNEKEIIKQENEIALALQKQVSLLDLHFNSKQNEVKKKPSGLKIFKAISDSSVMKGIDTRNDSINQHVLELFEKDKQYNITREKLVGLTIRYNPDLEEVYQLIAEKFATDDEHNKLLNSYKKTVVSLLNEINTKNLRTLGEIFNCIEFILDRCKLYLRPHLVDDCKKHAIDTKKTVCTIKDEIVSYIVRTACEYSEGSPVYNWTDGARFGLVDFGTQLNNEHSYGYAFVDEYWQFLNVDEDTIKDDFNKRVTEALELLVSRKENSIHKELALYTLSSGNCWNQETASALLEQLKNELSNKEYEAIEFKNIIELLIRINDPQTGMYSGLLGEDDKTFEIDKDNNQILLYGRPFFKLVDIPEYVDLMLRYFEDTNFYIDKQMLEYHSKDLSKVEQYNQYIKPIIDRIDEEENKNLNVTENGNSIFDSINDDLFTFIKSNHDSYIRKHQFFSIYGYDSFDNILIQNDPIAIYQLSETISSIYNISNLRDFFVADLDVIEKLYSSLYEDRLNNRKKYNVNLDRDKEMRLRELEVNLHGYLRKLRE